MKRIKLLAAISLSTAITMVMATACLGVAHAGEFATPLFASDSAPFSFEEQLLRKFPSSAGSKTAPAFAGFHSVVKGTEVIFISDDFSILIRGEVVELKDGKSLTTALAEANKPILDVTKLDTKDAISFGQGSKTIYVFSDPDCPFCKQLESELSKLIDTKVFIFPFPLTSLHPNSKVVAEAIWCSPNRAKAWKDYVIKGVVPKSASCPTPIERNLALGQSMQIQGTPSIIFTDGSVIPGAVPVERIAAKLDTIQSVKVGGSK